MVKCLECGQEKPDPHYYYLYFVSRDGLSRVDEVGEAAYRAACNGADYFRPFNYQEIALANEDKEADACPVLSRRYRFVGEDLGCNTSRLKFREVVE